MSLKITVQRSVWPRRYRDGGESLRMLYRIRRPETGERVGIEEIEKAVDGLLGAELGYDPGPINCD